MQHSITPMCSPVSPFATWHGAFTDEELTWLQQRALRADINAQVGSSEGDIIDASIRRSFVSWMQKDPETAWVFGRIGTVAAKLNAESFRFSLSGLGEGMQLTRYDAEYSGTYGWHQDMGAGISRKLSLVLQLSDPSEYEGGNLEILTKGSPDVVPKQRGLIVAFPTWTLHQVTPVTKGSRQSLVTWVSGEPFR